MAKKVEVVDQEVIGTKYRMDNLVLEIKAVEQEQAELAALFQFKMHELKDQYNEKVLGFEDKKDYLMTQVRGLFDTVPSKETATQRKVALLSGDVVVTKAKQKIDYDKAKLLEWAKENKYIEFIKEKVTEEFNWADFKAQLVIDSGKIIVKDTGEVVTVDGVCIVEEPEKVVIK